MKLIYTWVWLIAALSLVAGCVTASKDPVQSGPIATCHVCRYNNDLACVNIHVKATTQHTDYQGTTYYFCSEDCREAFLKNPQKYLPKTQKPKRSKTASSRSSVETQLPASCTLLAMSPPERAAHQQRLNDLRNAGRLLRETSEGFVFAVDLRRLSEPDLNVWMANEQKCCSFLRMTSQRIASNEISEVTVTYPSETRSEVMRRTNDLLDLPDQGVSHIFSVIYL